MKINKIDVLNTFSPFSKAWNQSPIEYSIEFALYQRLNSSFGWIFNGFGHLPIGRRIFEREAPTPTQLVPRPQRVKMLRRIGKWPNPLNIQSNDEFNRW